MSSREERRNDTADENGEEEDELFEEEVEDEDHLTADRFSPVSNIGKESMSPSDRSRSINRSAELKSGKEKGVYYSLPPRKPDITEITMQLPGMGDDFMTVHVRLTPAIDLQPPKGNWLKEVEKDGEIDEEAQEEEEQGRDEEDEENEEEEDEEGDEDEDENGTVPRKRGGTQLGKGKKEANEEEEGDNEEEEENSDVNATKERLCPPWLLPLLSDDAFYWEHTLDKMFGYELPPSPNIDACGDPKSAIRRPRTSRDDGDGDAEDQTGDKLKTPDKVVITDAADDKSAASGDSSDADGDIREGELSTITVPTNQTSKQLEAQPRPARFSLQSSSSLGMNVQNQFPKRPVLRFTEASRLFYIVRSIGGKRWYLLDTLPMPEEESEEDVEEEAMEEVEEGEESEEDETNSASGSTETGDQNLDEEREKNVEGDQAKEPMEQAVGAQPDVDQVEEEEDDGGVPDASMLDMQSVICIDTLTLAALRCPAALRTCLVQKDPISLACIETWMRLDVNIALPILTTIYRTMLAIRAEAPRLPYSLPDWKFDYNIFLTSSYLAHRKPQYPRQTANLVSSTSQILTVVDSPCVGERQSYETMAGLLSVRTFPSKPILLQNLNHVVGMRLFVWLITEIPHHVLLQWASLKSSPPDSGRKDAETGSESDDGDDEEDEEGDGKKKAARYIASVVDAFWKRVPSVDGPYLILSPFLKAVVVEVRRRQRREREGFGASKYTLMECVAHALPKRIEDGKPKKDPLVASSFSLFPQNYGPPELSTPSPPNQRVYQSDLVILLLTLTTTPATRDATTVRTERLALGVRSHPRPLSYAPDGNYELLTYLLNKKTEKVRTPVEAVRSGYFRVLYLSLLRFVAPSSVMLLLSVTPLFSVMGPADRCPLPQLLHAWHIEWDFCFRGHLDHFINTFWNELYYRTLEKQFDDATVLRAKQLMLLEKVTERRNQYLFAIRQLNSRARPLSARAFVGFPVLVGEECEETLAISSTLEALPPIKPRKIIKSSEHPLNLSPYSEDWRHEEEHVRYMLASLPMAPRTYLTPETLHLLLFDVPHANRYAIHYLMRGCGVVQTQINPLKGAAVPAMEYALLTRNVEAVLMLLATGETLDDQMLGGMVNGEAWLYEAFRGRDAMRLLAVWRKKEQERKSDPDVRFGVLRTIPTSE